MLNGVVLVSYIRSCARRASGSRRRSCKGPKVRFRPVMMTATVAALGLVPFLFATGPGSEVQRPLAIVVIGGLVTSTLLTLVIVPILYDGSSLGSLILRWAVMAWMNEYLPASACNRAFCNRAFCYSICR